MKGVGGGSVETEGSEEKIQNLIALYIDMEN